MSRNTRLMVIAGSPGSGKDQIIRAVHDLGTVHAAIVPKHTTRLRRSDDGDEMICPNDRGFDIDACDVVYENFTDRYGIETSRIWNALKRQVFPVAVVSNQHAIDDLRRVFGRLMVLVYVHSEMTPAEYRELEAGSDEDRKYVEERVSDYRKAFDLYLDHYLEFDHVLLYAGVAEDLYDQVFRLFRAYEAGVLG